MFAIKPLPYGYDALEPVIDEATMRVHHDKHYQTYCDKLNAALEKYSDWQSKTIEELISNLDSLPEEVRGAVRNMGGGFLNHTLFFDLLSPPGEGGGPGPELLSAIEEKWGSLENFQSEFTNKATSLFGSGWTCLVKGSDSKLEIVNLPNQDSSLTTGGKTILLLDVWEHAYYLKYQNRRADYVGGWWGIINWQKVGELYSQ